MNSFKSTCVVLALAGVLYGVYVTLNAPPPANNAALDRLAEVQPPTIDFGAASQAPTLSVPELTPPSTSPPLLAEPEVTRPEANLAIASPEGAAEQATFTTPEQSPSIAPPEYRPPSEPPATTLPAAPGETASAYTLPSSPAPVASNTSPALEAYKLQRAWATVDQHVKDGKFRDALLELSPFASNPHLTPEDRRAVYTWLDALAGKVIYGPEHFLGEPFKVTNRGQTLYEVAAAYKVPTQLLLNINSQSVKDPQVLLPGTELKVIPGPFRAEVSLAAGELTLYVGQLYAGRFAFTVGDERPLEGTHHVKQKHQSRAFVGRDGRQFAADDPANPYGGVWIDLGADVSLHGSPANGQSLGLGCLSFSPQDALDLYGILSPGSEVVIKP